jgi:hypothetical protein
MAAPIPNDLLEEAKCYLCLGISMAEALELALLARISAGGSSSSGLGYTIPLTIVSMLSPADSTNYFFGCPITSSTLTNYTNSTFHSIEIPKAGTIKRVSFNVRVTGTLGSNENVLLGLLYNQAFDQSLSNIAFSATSQRVTSTAERAVSAGDLICGQMQCPLWATNPTLLSVTGLIYIE